MLCLALVTPQLVSVFVNASHTSYMLLIERCVIYQSNLNIMFAMKLMDFIFYCDEYVVEICLKKQDAQIS